MTMKQHHQTKLTPIPNRGAVAPKGRRPATYGIRATCTCGWRGPERFLSEGLMGEAQAKAQDDARDHRLMTCSDCGAVSDVLHTHTVTYGKTVVARGERICPECYGKRGGRSLHDIERDFIREGGMDHE